MIMMKTRMTAVMMRMPRVVKTQMTKMRTRKKRGRKTIW